jgi:proteic killer suppression protein
LYGVIKSFRDEETERLWKEERTRRIPADLRKPALKKLQMLNAATALTDLLVPPGNRLERLQGDREGQYSIRINDQYRICFAWRESNAYEVEITDYH